MSRQLTHTSSFRRIAFSAVVIGLSLSAAAQSLTITTLAGQIGTNGSADGTGTAARFTWANGIVADASGTLHLVDANNFTVRRVTPAGVVTTVAGAAGQKEHRDGTGTAARFYQPRGLARDAAGNLYVADTNPASPGATVRKISTTGVVTTHLSNLQAATALAIDAAGNLIVAGGLKLRAFSSSLVELPPTWAPGLPETGFVSALAVDRDGGVFLLDGVNHWIRKIAPSGTIVTVAGAWGAAGYVDGAGALARFSFPRGLALDSAGNAFVADGNNPVVRKITPAGIVTTVAGSISVAAPGASRDGLGSNARFSGLFSLAVGADDAVYVGDLGAIRKGVVVSSAAKIATAPSDQLVSAGERAVFSVGANGYPATSYQWQRANSAGVVWVNVADTGLYSGATTAVLTINGVTPGMNGDRFRCVVTNSLGSDTSASATLTVDPPVVVVPLRVSTLAGRAGTQGFADGVGANALLSGPTGVATDATGNVLVADTVGNRIRKITPGGTVTTLAGNGIVGVADGTGTAAQFHRPGPMAVDAQGNVFVADQLFVPDFAALPVIRKITPTGVVTTFVRGGTGGVRFNLINGLAFDRSGNLVVSCSAEGVVRFAPSGAIITTPLSSSALPGTGGIAFDAAGNLYIADTANHAILKVATTGLATLVAGKPGTAGAADGRAAVARFRLPTGVAVDSAGNIYVVDTGNHVIRRVTPAGVVSTVAAAAPTASQANPVGAADGIGATARFNGPQGIAIDRAGNLHIADTQNHTIRRAVPSDAVGLGQSAALYAQTTGSEPTSALAHEPKRAALGTGSTYQWFKDSVAIAGATNEQLLMASVGLSDQGSYAVQVTTSDGVSRSEPVALTVTGGRLVNLSIRSYAGSSEGTLIVGFVVSGPGLPLLARGVGPALIPFGVSGALSTPRLVLHARHTLLASNAGWANSPDISDAAGRVGAFALPPESNDAAMLSTLETGAYSVQCAADSGTGGVALVELYDASVTDAARSRLMNVSARSRVGAGDDVMIAGFSIRGIAPRRILLRGVGPTLGQFGVEGALADPQLLLFDSGGTLRAQNDDWSDNTNAAEITATTPSVGAFPLPNRSKDAVLLLSLNPGTYSVQVSGSDTAAGIALVEVYEVP